LYRRCGDIANYSSTCARIAPTEPKLSAVFVLSETNEAARIVLFVGDLRIEMH
jgi:hypothetical protein